MKQNGNESKVIEEGPSILLQPKNSSDLNIKYFQDFLSFLQFSQPVCPFIDWKMIKRKNGELIGSGSFGEVAIVEVSDFSKPLALKIIDSIHWNDKNEVQRVIREIQLLHSCSHPNILPLYGISFNKDKTPNEIGILTPLKWGSLAKLLDLVYKGQASEENLPPGIEFNNETKQKIIFGISAGLLYLSSKKIIHRDIKPENILLDDDFNPLLCDFGFAKQTVSKESMIQSQICIGTVPYEAPEIFMGTVGNYNEKVDIYAWAIVVNSILQEEMPWKELFAANPNITDFVFKRMVDEGRRPRLIEGEEYKIYRKLIERGWNKDPKERPSTEDILENILEKEAMLPGVDKLRIKEYQKQALDTISSFSLSLLGKIHHIQVKNDKIKKEIEEQKKQNEEQKKQNEEQMNAVIKLRNEIETQKRESQKIKEEMKKLKEILGKILNSSNLPQKPVQIIKEEKLKDQQNTTKMSITQKQNDSFEAKFANDGNHKSDPKFTKLHFAAKINDAEIGMEGATKMDEKIQNILLKTLGKT